MDSKIKNDIANLLLAKGFLKGKSDSYSLVIPTDDGNRLYRYKIQEISLRKEIQCIHPATTYSPASKSWVCLWTAYLKDIEVGDRIIVKKKLK